MYTASGEYKCPGEQKQAKGGEWEKYFSSSSSAQQPTHKCSSATCKIHKQEVAKVNNGPFATANHSWCT